MIKTRVNSINLLHFPGLARYKTISHFITTREGGTSPKPFDTLNLAFHTQDQFNNVLRNRLTLARALNIAPDALVNGEQVHGANIAIVREKGLTLPNTDGIITDKPGICLLVLVADCVPLLFFHPEKRVIGVAHAGWKGTVARIAQKAVQTLKQRFNCEPENLRVGIGPAIGPCCYEVRADVVQLVRQTQPESDKLLIQRDGAWYLDLIKANETQLLNAGVQKQNIETANLCTHCHSNTFFSARAARGPTGRFGAGIMLNP
ncbi:peptidoglycan editing factor PgeF [candidate division WOR-3 bacterium]|nr:peptidoglycan editing factor PgeF [candidate division WOR-3 bacterium]